MYRVQFILTKDGNTQIFSAPPMSSDIAARAFMVGAAMNYKALGYGVEASVVEIKHETGARLCS